MVQGNQIASINACAAYFAQADYYVTVSFYSCVCHCVVFFYNPKKKESIIKSMRCFKDENDTIEYRELRTDEGEKFYTLTLTKEAQL